MKSKMDINSLVRRLIWSLRLVLIPAYYRNLRALRKLEIASREEVVDYQNKRLISLLQHCVSNVPYYRELFAASGEKDLLKWYSNLKPLSKDDVRRNSDDLYSEIKQKGEYNNTSGGSTGEPLKFKQDIHYRTWGRAITDLFDNWSGYHFGNRMIRLWGSERDLFIGRENFKTTVGKFSRNEKWINSFKMSSEDMKKAVKTINRFQPVQIVAYVESINSLALFVKEHNLHVHSPRSIMTSAGTMYDYMRKNIESAFNCRVYNRYGSREVGNVASQYDKEDGLYICEPNYHVEILDENLNPTPEGDIGELYITNLSNYSMPLLKYQIGDCAIPMDGYGKGPKWKRLKNVIGRSTDFFQNEKGEKVHGEYFTHLLYEICGVQKFQFIQTALNKIDLKMVLMNTDRLPIADENQIEKGVKEVMGENCQLKFIYLEAIEPLKSGKFQYIISKL